MNKRIDFSYTGGFPATQYMVDFMQDSFRSCFMAIAALIGDKVIVQGCNVVGGNVTNGWISVNGELIPFIGGALPGGASVIVIETPASRLFDDGATHDVYYVKTATIGSPGAFLFSDLKRVDVYKDLVDSFATLLNNFNTHTHSWTSITGKPSEFISYRGSFNLGDVNPTDIVRTVTMPDQGTTNYHVVGLWVGNNANWDANNDVLPPVIFDKAVDSFKIGIREVYNSSQNVRFDYIIIKSL